MFNPNDSRQLNRFAVAAERSRWLMQPAREHRMSFLQSYCGAHYSASASPVPDPINLLKQASDIYLRALAPRAPRALVTTRDPQLKPIAADMQAWMDRASDQMDLVGSLRLWVMNALHSTSVMKVAEASAETLDIFGETMTVGQPFAEPVDLDDLLLDMTAKRWGQLLYVGNRWRTSLEEAKENNRFDKKSREKLTAMNRFAYNERGDLRSTTLSQSTMGHYEEFEDSVELWDVWFPKERIVIVVPYQDSIVGSFSSDKPLAIIEWGKGPREGPFHELNFGPVPNNVMSAAPLQALIDLHRLINEGQRKLGRQLHRQKVITTFAGTATDDADRINRTDDGMAVRVDNPERIKEQRMGGVDAPSMAAILQWKTVFDEMAGNLQSIGGLGPQSPTLGQDKLISEQASAQVQEMQDRTVAGTRKVFEALGQLWWENPVLTYSASREVAGMQIPVDITPQMRQIPWDKLSFSIDPYSMQNQSPQSKAGQLMQIVQTLLMPAMGQMQQQGITLKMPALLEILGRYGDLPELADILEQGPPPDQQGAAQAAQSAVQHAPAVTSRTNTRVNAPTQTPKNASSVMAQTLMGAANRQQANGLAR